MLIVRKKKRKIWVVHLPFQQFPTCPYGQSTQGTPKLSLLANDAQSLTMTAATMKIRTLGAPPERTREVDHGPLYKDGELPLVIDVAAAEVLCFLQTI